MIEFKNMQDPLGNHSMWAKWGPRGEDVAALARRFLKTLDLLREIDPVFKDWWFVRGPFNCVPMNEMDYRHLATLIAEHVSRDDDGTPEPEYGFYGSALNNDDQRSPRAAALSVHAGNIHPAPSPAFWNTAQLRTDELIPEDTTVFTPDLFRRALLALVSGWEPTLCSLLSRELLRVDAPPPPIFYPGTLILPPPRKPKIGLAWMTYLEPPLASLVTPPRSAIVERTDEGGLLMIATMDRFSIANPKHMAVAREIEATLAAADAFLWPPDTGRRGAYRH